MNREIVFIQTEWIKLDQLLKFSGAVDTGGHGKELILSGKVMVNGEVCLQRGRKIRPGDLITALGEEYLIQAEAVPL